MISFAFCAETADPTIERCATGGHSGWKRLPFSTPLKTSAKPIGSPAAADAQVPSATAQVAKTDFQRGMSLLLVGTNHGRGRRRRARASTASRRVADVREGLRPGLAVRPLGLVSE